MQKQIHVNNKFKLTLSLLAFVDGTIRNKTAIRNYYNLFNELDYLTVTRQIKVVIWNFQKKFLPKSTIETDVVK